MIGPLSPEDHTLTEAVAIWSCHTICQHGFHSPPKLSCLRIAILTGVVLGLILYVSYSAQLVSIFSITTPPIKNIEDLLKSQINIVVDENNQRARNMIEVQLIYRYLVKFPQNGDASHVQPRLFFENVILNEQLFRNTIYFGRCEKFGKFWKPQVRENARFSSGIFALGRQLRSSANLRRQKL